MLPGGKPAYLVDIATVLPVLLSLHYWDISDLKVSYLDLAVAAYLIISVSSIILYFQADNPTNKIAYFYGIHYFVLPISLYYAVKSFNFSQQYRILRYICYLNVAAIIIGIGLFFLRPNFYYKHLVEEFAASGMVLEDWQIFGRMQSYLGSTALGSIIAPTIVLFALLRFPKKVLAVLVPIMFLGALLTFQRGGFLAALIAVLYTFIKIRGTPLFKLIMSVACLLMLTAGIVYFSNVEENSMERILDKYSLSSMYDSGFDFEKRGYGPGLSYFRDFPMGVGLGATSSIADTMGLATRGQVADANFMRILADLGLFGLLSFFFVLLAATRAALKRKDGFGWLLVFGLITAICVGTNTLDSYYVSHSFWLFLGVIDTKPNRPNDQHEC
jgi:hypothetical protein